MANLRIRVNNQSELQDQLPKLKRSLSAQKGIELKEEGNGVFLLVIKDAISIKTLQNVKSLVDSYNFSFYYPDEEYSEEDANAEFAENCQCAECVAARERQQKALRAKQRVAAEKKRKQEEELRKLKEAQALVEIQKKAQHDAVLDRLLKEALSTLNKRQ
jgi:hypothetical protein